MLHDSTAGEGVDNPGSHDYTPLEMSDEHPPAASDTPSAPSMAVPTRVDAPAVSGPPHLRREPRTEPGRGGLYLVVGLVVAASALVAFVLTGIEDKGIYAKPVDELVKNKSKFAGRPVRADGLLVHGTLVKVEQPCEYKFTLEKNGVEIPVSYKACVVPDTFRDMPDTRVEVTVEGQLTPSGAFEASKVLAKCPSKYEMNDRAQKGEKAPHAAVGVPR